MSLSFASFYFTTCLILEEMDEARDSVRFYVLGNRYHSKVEHYGVSPALSMDEPLIL